MYRFSIGYLKLIPDQYFFQYQIGATLTRNTTLRLDWVRQLHILFVNLINILQKTQTKLNNNFRPGAVLV